MTDSPLDSTASSLFVQLLRVAVGRMSSAPCRPDALRLPRDDLSTPSLPLSVVTQSWAIAEKTCGPDIGFLVARALHLGDVDAHGYLLRAATTLGDAIDALTRFDRLMHSEADLVCERDGDRLTLALDIGGPSHPESLIECLMATLVRLARFIFGPFPLTVVRFPHARRCDPALARATLGCRVEFDAERAEIQTSADVVTLPNPVGDPELAVEITDLLTQRLDRMEAGATLETKVYALVLEGLPKRETGANHIAHELGISERTLRRHLAESGTSHRQILEEARRETAIRMLGAQLLSVDEVAYHLGYAQPSSFQRAFKRWTGMPPATFRARCGRASTIPPRQG